MLNVRLVVVDGTGAVVAYEACNAGREQARHRARTWTALGYVVEVWADSGRVVNPYLV